MPDSAVNDETLGTFLLDGELPRLAAPPTPVLQSTALSVTPDAASFAPPPPGSAPLLTSAEPTLPMPTLASPVLPGSVQVLDGTASSGGNDDTEGPADTGAPAHPMAHLMPGKVQPSESSLRAAQIRAEKKAKARKKKIIALVIALVIGAVVGPPFARWLVDAINEAGSTPTETVPPTTVTDAASDGVTGGAAVAVGAPSQARDVVAGTNAQTDAVTAATPAP
jgi:hypothetical protein